MINGKQDVCNCLRDSCVCVCRGKDDRDRLEEGEEEDEESYPVL